MVKSPAKWIKKILHISSSGSSSSSKIPSKDAHPDKLSKKQKKGKGKHKQNDEKLFPRDETTDQDLPISLPGQVEAVVAEEQRQPSVMSEVDANTTPELISDVILKAPTESNGGFDSPTFPDDETFSVVSKDISVVKKEVEEENEEAVVTEELKKLSLESVVVEEKKKLSLEPIVVEEQKKLSLKPVILEGQNNLSLEPIVVEEKKEAILEPVVVEEQLPVAVEEQSKISLEPVVVEEQKKLSPEPVVVKEKKELILEAVVVEEQNKLSLEAVVAEEKKNLSLEAEDEAEAVFDSKLEAPEVSIGVVDSPTFINGSLPVVTKDIPVVNKEEEEAALIIQTAFRGHIARHALKALKGLVRLQALVRGHLVRRQAATTLRCLQALVRVQARIRARRVRISEEGQAVQDRLKQRQHKTPSRLRKSEEGGYLSNSKEINKIVKQEATVRREQALASAFSRQLALATENQSSLIIDLDGGAADRSHWGWSWLERWMVARPWETSTIDEKYPPPPKEDVGDSSDMVSRSIEGGPLASSQASLDALDVDFLNQVLSRVDESSMGHVNEAEISTPISNAEVQDEQCSFKDMVENPSEKCDDSIDVKECELNIHGGPSVNGDGEKNTSDNSLTVVTNSTPEIPIRAVEVVDEVPEEIKVTSNKLPTDVDGECITVDSEAAKMKPILDNELGEENQPIAQTQDGNPSVVVADDIEEPCHHSNEPCISDNNIEVGSEQGSVVKGPSSKRPSRSKQFSQTEKAMKVNRSIKPKSGSTRQSLPVPPKETTQGERAQPRYMATTQASLAKSRFQEGISQEKEKPLKRQMSTPIHSKQIPSTPSTPRHELLRPSSSRGKPELLPSRV